MKTKLLSLLFIVFLCLPVSANIRSFYGQNGSLSGDLDVAGDVQVTGNAYITGTANISAGLIVDTDTLTVDQSTNRVGIGTATPEGLLNIADSTAGVVTPNANADQLVIEGSDHSGISILASDSKDGQVVFGTPNNGSLAGLLRYRGSSSTLTLGTNSTDGNLQFVTGTFSTALSILKDGKVGVSTTTPQKEFSVVGDVQVTGSMFIDASTNEIAGEFVVEGAVGIYTANVSGGTI